MPTLLDIIKSETLDPPDRVQGVLSRIQTRHADRVEAIIYYGSSMRELDSPEKMLDFYVLVDSYRKTHGFRPRALINRLLPPAVYYLEQPDDTGLISTCKYSIITLGEFEKRCSNRAFLSQIWGRFSQPCAVLWSKNESALSRVWHARINAVKRMASETTPLFNGKASASEFWGRGFFESYRTELRPESSTKRSEEIVLRYQDRYESIMDALYGEADPDGTFKLPEKNLKPTKLRWFLRRCFGKPANALRVLFSAATFDGGLDYIARKVENHSGVKLEATDLQRRHPVLFSPILFFKLWKKGAFR